MGNAEIQGCSRPGARRLCARARRTQQSHPLSFATGSTIFGVLIKKMRLIEENDIMVHRLRVRYSQRHGAQCGNSTRTFSSGCFDIDFLCQPANTHSDVVGASGAISRAEIMGIPKKCWSFWAHFSKKMWLAPAASTSSKNTGQSEARPACRRAVSSESLFPGEPEQKRA